MRSAAEPGSPRALYNWGGQAGLGCRVDSPPAGGGVSGAGPERAFLGPRLGRAELPAAPTMAAAALGQIWARKLLPVPWPLCGPRRYASSNFKAADLQLQLTQKPHKKPDPSKPLVFGKTFTDHMLMVEWNEEKGWGQPRIQPFQNLMLHPACSAIHYSQQLFEGMKAFRGSDQRVRLFRPWLNMDRMLCSALRLCLPSFDKAELLECIRRLVEVDKDWVPASTGTSLYVRPVFIGNELEAKRKGCEQVLWLYGPDQQLTEVGTMNIFIYWTHEDGVLELVTPPLDGVILPGVVRQSLLDLAQTWGEFRVVERKITMKEMLRALEEGRVREVFGSGTACQVCPVHQILYEGKHLHIPTMENGPELVLRFQKELKAIQYGTRAHEWMFPV
ncbi:branched-chain-amino-acid aminotransferase, mitochondrial isoform X3 [Diceros bicornis minor]|uniref:branched-chain-amino-acid aminotransferase, mitochondrial isoform X3 n=1 Tax=Diceros bicornis minor TaxID=77932 RepID=UPI0026EC11CC|nr:branched-chain-amino-acid aminotransferase, mitochondrial isoform X3 [Diceros bicornis minor]